MINALIIDDEKHARDSLQRLIKKYCPDITIAAICENAGAGLKEIEAKQPQLVFLDVEMPGKTGFEMLAEIPDIHFDIIFTTAFDHYAIRAIRFGALDYLIKPIDKDELRLAVDAFLNRTRRDTVKQLHALLTHVRQEKNFAFQKVAFPTLHGYELIPLNNIVMCESSSNYTNVFLKNGQHLVVSRTLKEIEDMLDTLPFFRIHHSNLVNLEYASRYIKGEGGFLELTTNITVPVSRNRKEELLKIITHLSS